MSAVSTPQEQANCARKLGRGRRMELRYDQISRVPNKRSKSDDNGYRSSYLKVVAERDHRAGSALAVKAAAQAASAH